VPAMVAVTRSRVAAGNVVARLGLLLADEYLEFLAGRLAGRQVRRTAILAAPGHRFRQAELLTALPVHKNQPKPRSSALPPDWSVCAADSGDVFGWGQSV
jgi:hypothetical protein